MRSRCFKQHLAQQFARRRQRVIGAGRRPEFAIVNVTVNGVAVVGEAGWTASAEGDRSTSG